MSNLEIKMQSVSSSNLVSVGYDEDSKTLRVVFKNGSTYDYSSVPQRTYEDLLNAESIGSYFHNNIRSDFSFKKR